MEKMNSLKNTIYEKILNSYYKAFMENNVDFGDFEDKLFNNISDKKRIVFELELINKVLKNDSKKYFLYNDYYEEIASKIKVVDLTDIVIPEIKKMIVNLDLRLGLPVHLYSVIPLLKEELKENNNVRTK